MPAPVIPTPVVPVPVVPVPVVPIPAVPVPVIPVPVAPTTVTPAPVVPTPVPPPPVTPAPVVPTPVVPSPVVPPPVITPPSIPAPVTPPPVVPEIQGRNIVLENGKQGILNSIYFEPDTAVLIESYRPILEMVGRYLAADPGLQCLIRAYAADFGTSNGRYIVSVNRARFSRDFYTEKYGISSNRFSIEVYGSDKSPIYATDDWQSHRCVELILFKE
jgi:outer membrane protein OmpA-like peptidoglycan-associated protein